MREHEPKPDILTDKWTIDRAQKLDHVARRLRRTQTILQNQKIFPTLSLYTDMEGQDRSYPIDFQTALGIYKIRKSLMSDLAQVNEAELAEDIVYYVDHERKPT